MSPTKAGQIVKFHTPLPDENPNQLYVVLEIKQDIERPRVDIKALNTGLSFPPISTVKLNDLEVVPVSTQDLIGHQVTISKSDKSKVKGKVITVDESELMLDLDKGEDGVETNVNLTVVDNEGLEHKGKLFVN